MIDDARNHEREGYMPVSHRVRRDWSSNLQHVVNEVPPRQASVPVL
jgi:hypothetical protein